MDAQETISSIHVSDLFQQNKENKRDLVRIGENLPKVDVVYIFHNTILQNRTKQTTHRKVMTHRCSRISNIIRTWDYHCSFTNPALLEPLGGEAKWTKSGALTSYLGAESWREQPRVYRLLHRWSLQQYQAFTGPISFELLAGSRDLWKAKSWEERRAEAESFFREDKWSQRHECLAETLKYMFDAI